MSQHPKQTNHETSKALPPPFQALNAPVPRCEAPECGELLHLVLPRSEIEFNARNVTVALLELMQMRDLPKGTDWFVVGASEAGSQIHVASRSLRRSEEVLSRCALRSSRCPYMHVRAVWAYQDPISRGSVNEIAGMNVIIISAANIAK